MLFFDTLCTLNYLLPIKVHHEKKYCMKQFILFVIVFLLHFSAFSQKSTDTIESQLRDLKGEKRIELLLKAARSASGSNPEKTISYAGMALKIAGELNRQDNSAEACFLLSGGYLYAGKPDSALFFAQKSLKLYQSLNNTEGIIKASNNLGLVFLSNSNTEMAEKIFIQAFNDCNLCLQTKPSSQPVKDLAAEVLNNLNIIYIKQGNYAKAKEKLLQFSKRHEYGHSYSGMIIQRTLASVYQSLGQYDSSLVYADHALSMAQEIKDPFNIGKIYTDIGTTHYYMGKYSKALNYYEKAREILLQVNDKPQMAKLYNNMASTYKQISYYEKATKYFLESARLKEELADSDGLAATYNNLGLVYFDWDNNKMTGYFLKKAITLNLKRNNRKYLATNYTALGDLYVDLKQADSAIYYYRKSLELKTEMGNKYGIVISLHCLADVYAGLLMNETQAMEYYEQALALANSIGSESEIASLSTDLGELMYNKGRLHAAGELFREALVYASQENSLELVQKCSRYLTEISIVTGNTVSAKDYFSLYRITGDSLFSEGKTTAILEMQTRFETEKKEQENLLLQKAIDLQKSQIKNLTGVAVLLLILGFVIFFLYRQKSKAFRQIVQKNLEIVKAEKHMDAMNEMSVPNDHAFVIPPNDDVENTTLGLLVKFNRLMKEEKPYLEAGLTVDDICKKINTNRSYLAQMIHDNFNQNFNGLINELRIKEARRLLTESKHDHISIEGIGEMAGFSNKVTFHSIFKKQIGVTPFYFRKSLVHS